MPQVDFFISYAAPDKVWARWVAGVLESAGYTTYVLDRDLIPGSDFVQAVSKSLEGAERTIILLSRNYLTSQFADAEWRASFAQDPSGERGLLLPVRIDDVRPTGLLAARAYIDLVGLDEGAATAVLLTGVSTTRRPAAATEYPFPTNPGAGPTKPKSASHKKSAADGEVATPGGGRAAPPSTGKGNVFISYSHRDRRWLNRLLVHLKPLQRAEQLNIWDDSKIKPGQLWKDEIEEALRAAQIALLLVSADFLASDFIADTEVPELLTGAAQRGTIIMPVILSPCRFAHTTSLRDFQAMNSPEKSLTGMTSHRREEFFVGLAGAIEDALESLIGTNQM